MKNLFRIITTVGLLITFSGFNAAKASHISGGDMAYQCLGNDSFLITLNLFRDCYGISMPTQYTINATSSCGTIPLTVTLINPGGYEISQLCPQDIGNSTCNGGPLPGMQMYIYQGIVVLNPPCSDWTIGWSTCCRNAAITNLQSASSQSTYIEATLNTVTDSCNSSPIFTAQPIPYVCINQQVTYSYGVVEPDGVDSMAFSFTCPLGGPSSCLTFNAPWNSNTPITGIIIDPATGLITFTPTMTGSFVVTILVEEYDENGNLIGTVMRDIQFVVQNCSNQVPNPGDGMITNLSGTAVISDSINQMSLQMCEGNNFCFDISIGDPDTVDIVTLSSTVTQALPGATFVTNAGNPATATICWTAPPSQSFFNTFSITAEDDACPVPGLQIYVYDVSVINSTLAFQDQILCNNQSAQLSVTGGSQFVWTTLYGDSIQVGTNISCDSCPNPTVNPSQTTAYLVTSDLDGSCENTDTVTISVVPDFTYTTTQTSNSGCMYEDIQFTITQDSAGVYTYDWSPANLLDDPNINNPTAQIIYPGSYDFYVDITSPFGCVQSDTFNVVIDSFVQPQLAASISDTLICEGESVQLDAQVSFPPVYCTYTIEMNDVSCNGWDGALLQVLVNSQLITPTGITNTGSCSESYTFQVQQGDIIDLNYMASIFEFDHSYIVYDGEGNVVFTDGPNPATGYVYSDTANCGVPTTGPFAFDWSPGTDLSGTSIQNPVASPSAPGTYTYQVAVQDVVGGCVDTAYVTVEVSADLAPQIQSAPDFCANETVPYTMSSTPSGGVWSGSGISNPNTGEFTPAVAYSNNGSGTQTVYYTVTNAAGCSFTDSTQVLIKPNPSAPFANGGIYCLNEYISLVASGESGATIEWYNDAALTDLASSGSGNYDYGNSMFDDTLYLSQTVDGCKSTPPNPPTMVVIDIMASPDIDALPPIGQVPLEVNFNDLSGISPWSNISWDFGDGGSSTQTSPTNEYDLPGAYLVTLTGEHPNGKICVDTMTIFVEGVSGMYVPNVFTPNGDGENDYFTMVLEGISSLKVTFYNRWGKKVYVYEHSGAIVSTESVNVWDGGKLSDGIYYYVIEATDVDGNPITHYYYNPANLTDENNGKVYSSDPSGCSTCLPVTGYVTMMRGK